MMNREILVIEDELEVQLSLKNSLENAGYIVEVASDGLEGAYKSGQKHYDLILLDIMLPKMDGYAVLEMIRKTSTVPVIMLTAMGTEENQLKGFELDVDDYIIKPFTMNLVLKRIEAVLRRSQAGNDSNLLTYKNLRLDPISGEVHLSEQELYLTSKEYDLLKLFMEQPTQLFTRDELFQRLWSDDYFGDDYLINVHIANLRKKINADYIQTVRGKGYRLAKENKE